MYSTCDCVSFFKSLTISSKESLKFEKIKYAPHNNKSMSINWEEIKLIIKKSIVNKGDITEGNNKCKKRSKGDNTMNRVNINKPW